MLCEKIQDWLSLYFDDALGASERAACDGHLDVCPVCRARLADLRSLTRGLRMLAAPARPAKLISSVNEVLRAEAEARLRRQHATLGDLISEWLQPLAMQYAVSSLASVLLFAAVFMALRPHMIALREASVAVDNPEPASRDTNRFDINQPISSESYAALRSPFNAQSPSLNPSGALAAMMWGPGHNHRRQDADDMVVVTDVFSNGMASLADVVQAPRDRRMLDDFQRALRQDAAFVPASLDRRPETMRVVFAVERVDVRN